jgi:4-hydroxy-tetrahydrodipicolinate synthase
LAGVIVPIVTPVDLEDRVDEDAFRKMIDRLLQAKVNGLFVGGSAGEGPLLVFGEWRRMLEIARDEVRGRVPILGGAMDTSSKRIRERIAALVEMRYQYFVVAPSFYITLKTPDEHLRLFMECAKEAKGMGMLAYNIPSCTGSTIPVEVFTELARRGVIRYCKESSGDIPYFKRIVSEGAPLGLKAFMGDEPGITEGLKAGGCGVVPVCANVEPATFIRAYQAALRKDWAELSQMQERVEVLRRNILSAGASWIAGIKCALAAKGMGSGRVVSPLEPLTEQQKRTVEAFMA